ncbi:fimbrial protein [unidentified bacterial endosymbiont]|uniref:fimbrial protein n=1 Tax=unidentified bacterial endosymbiont TaxID=2355 RepID=UPI00209D4D4F|nr:hypothetical protein [unidentified bacterial endosymbiont]
MKSKYIALIIGTASLIASANVLATAGPTIKFTGSISDGGCTVKVNDSQDNVSLDMGAVDMSGLAINQSSDSMDFSINMSGCPDTVSNATLSFDGTASTKNGQYFALSGTNSNKVGLELKNAYGTVVKPNAADSVSIGLHDGDGKTKYTAQLVKLADKVDSTQFDVSVAVDIAYQ